VSTYSGPMILAPLWATFSICCTAPKCDCERLLWVTTRNAHREHIEPGSLPIPDMAPASRDSRGRGGRTPISGAEPPSASTGIALCAGNEKVDLADAGGVHRSDRSAVTHKSRPH
jgi:hypothetical protein